jgi:hypothetical protein
MTAGPRRVETLIPRNYEESLGLTTSMESKAFNCRRSQTLWMLPGTCQEVTQKYLRSQLLCIRDSKPTMGSNRKLVRGHGDHECKSTQVREKTLERAEIIF